MAQQIEERSGNGKPAEAGALDFATLETYVRTLAASQQGACTPARKLPEAFAKALRHATAISFDIFDTALIRYVDHPADVFLHLEQHPAFRAHSFQVPVARLRMRAESTARAMVAKLISSHEVNLLEIYQVFCDVAGLSREYAPAFLAAEEQIELALCVVNPPLHALYKQARAAGKQVLFVSDTYHTQEFLLRLLHSVDYEATPETIFASSAARKSKQSGELFPVVLATLALERPASSRCFIRIEPAARS
jgi:predicted HAD superfamily hydrolase